jgi:hypothetical protein
MPYADRMLRRHLQYGKRPHAGSSITVGNFLDDDHDY